jgi:predicted nucleic-acid-binding Zn-ribbon protein
MFSGGTTMVEAKTCPKCSGVMTQGKILKANEYTARGEYMYVFAADDEQGPDLSKIFSGKRLSKSRKPLVAFSCESCGFVEFYGIVTN